ncbi:hypothetical protein [Amnibacterium sp.]|uniref:hypothetical protein n=1 Tax=Amnibacterium sp. TaxID=1872496 RepID=UPI002613AC0B|nr:hypothetical protein [Amnibacterium sp.]
MQALDVCARAHGESQVLPAHAPVPMRLRNRFARCHEDELGLVALVPGARMVVPVPAAVAEGVEDGMELCPPALEVEDGDAEVIQERHATGRYRRPTSR